MKNKGFTLTELLVVLAISAAIFALGTSGITSLRNTELRDTTGSDIFSLFRDARQKAIDSRVSKVNSQWLWGYVVDFDYDSSNSIINICSFKWNDTDYNPSSDTDFPGNLTANISTIKADLNTNIQNCSASTSSEFNQDQSKDYNNNNFSIKLFTKDSGGHIPAYQNPTDQKMLKYLIFESLTGKVFMYDSSMNLMGDPSYDLSIKFKDGTSNGANGYLIRINNDETSPYVIK